ncbi:hypothetical protein NA57DRAFT_75926 [Rhizodiscina lignyota]|uniref:Uncharacterized protein n=1 Tax=Rhizodiscina lignyota TaxID=1504668 RepID=A0A9P4IET6_9PEZI|nr:hypothetical protein NA57DRAFT_75926 [Rhizodiscina lignyota]
MQDPEAEYSASGEDIERLSKVARLAKEQLDTSVQLANEQSNELRTEIENLERTVEEKDAAVIEKTKEVEQLKEKVKLTENDRDECLQENNRYREDHQRLRTLVCAIRDRRVSTAVDVGGFYDLVCGMMSKDEIAALL